MAAGLLLVRGPVDQIQSLAAREQDIKWIKDYTKTSKTSQNVFCGSYWVHGVERYTVRDVVDHKESPLVVPVLSRRNGFNLEKYWDQHAINIGMEINKKKLYFKPPVLMRCMAARVREADRKHTQWWRSQPPQVSLLQTCKKRGKSHEISWKQGQKATKITKTISTYFSWASAKPPSLARGSWIRWQSVEGLDSNKTNHDQMYKQRSVHLLGCLEPTVAVKNLKPSHNFWGSSTG